METTQRGLTLIELMVALTIAIILLAVGIPAFRGIEANNRAAAHANGFVTALNLARMEAVSRGFSVAVCPTTDGSSCGAVGDWARGLLVFTDQGNDGAPAAADLVKAFDLPRGSPSVTVTPNTATLVRFNARGERENETATRIKFQLDHAGTVGGQVRCLCVSLSGQITTKRAACTSDPNVCP